MKEGKTYFLAFKSFDMESMALKLGNDMNDYSCLLALDKHGKAGSK